MYEKKFQLDTITIQELGTAVLNGALEAKSSPDPLALDNFGKELNSVVPEMPKILQSGLTHFITNFSQGYADALEHRADIGRILLGTANEAEKQEVQKVNWFLDTPPQVLVK